MSIGIAQKTKINEYTFSSEYKKVSREILLEIWKVSIIKISLIFAIIFNIARVTISHKFFFKKDG